MNPRPTLDDLASNVPTFTATLHKRRSPPGSDDYSGSFPITDHEPVVVQTPVGPMVNLNIWCPGSPISPPFNPGGQDGLFCIENLADQNAQMKKIAEYLFNMARAGAVGFMLQELPLSNKDQFHILNQALNDLCAQHNKSNPQDKINLEFQPLPVKQTRDTQGGTCALVNKEKVKVIDKNPGATIGNPAMDQRFGHYEIQDANNPANKFEAFNIHGDFKYQAAVVDFAIKCKVGGAMVCGDLNISDPSAEADRLRAEFSNAKKGYKLGTLDVAQPPGPAPQFNAKIDANRAESIINNHRAQMQKIAQPNTPIQNPTPLDQQQVKANVDAFIANNPQFRDMKLGDPKMHDAQAFNAPLRDDPFKKHKQRPMVDYDPAHRQQLLDQLKVEKIHGVKNIVNVFAILNKKEPAILLGNGNPPMVQFRFDSKDDAKKFLKAAMQIFPDGKMMKEHARDNIVRLNEHQYSQLQQLLVRQPEYRARKLSIDLPDPNALERAPLPNANKPK